MTLPQNVLYYGSPDPLPAQTHLRAGPLSLVFEAGDLRYVRLGDQMLLLRVYVAIRDHNWGTVLPAISKLQMDTGSDSFRITYDVANRQGNIDFTWQGEIAGDSAGTITFSVDGEARSTFRRNRIGFCILHPMEVAGAPCRIEHVDGSLEESAFPTAIAPQLVEGGQVKPIYPFAEMRAMAHQVQPGRWAEVRYTGEIFEMEDQRNWTDASFKTYGTPLRLPFPVEIKAGTRIRQSVTLRLLGEPSLAAAPAGEQQLTFAVGSQPSGPLPRIGLGLASHGQSLSAREIERLQALHLSHLRADLHLADPAYPARLRQAAAEATALGAGLEVALFLSNDAEAQLAALLPLIDELNPPVHAWLIFHQAEPTTSERWVRLARQYLASYDPQAAIGSGTNIFFTELNRSRPPVEALDLVCYSTNPQVHAFDNLSLVETLAAQAATVESARQFCGDLPLAVTPVTLKMRFNPNATGPEPEPVPGQLPSQVDVRQMSLFGAGWTLGSIKYLAESGAASVTYYETTGWRGVMETASGSPLPDQFPSQPGTVFPLYHVLADLGEFAGAEILPSQSSNRLLVDGLALRHAGRTRVLLANLSPHLQRIRVQGLPGPVLVRHLDETTAASATAAPEAFRRNPGVQHASSDGRLDLDLLPYAVARVDQVL